MKYILRKVSPSDIGEIVILCEEHAHYENAQFSVLGKADKLFKLIFEHDPSLYCVVIESDSKIIGYATYSKECSTWEADFYLHMDCLYVKEGYRGGGIGRAVLKAIIEHAREMNAHHIEWQTPAFNKGAIEFYNKIGATSKEKLRFTLNI